MNAYNRIEYPPFVRVSCERLDANGAYIVENGQQMIMWLSRGIPSSFLEDIFGVSNLSEVDIQQVYILLFIKAFIA